MALSIRAIQQQSFIAIQVLVGAEGMSLLDFTISGGGAAYQTSTSTDPRFVDEPEAAKLTLGVVDNNTTSPDFSFAAIPGQVLDAGWVSILWLEHDQAAGASFDVDITVTAAQDALGANILGNVLAPAAGSYQHVEPTADQSAQYPLLDSMVPAMGFGSVDFIGRRHYSDYDPSNHLGPFGLAEGPVVNANLNAEEISTLIRVGFLSRGRGANAHKLFMTEVGKRGAGFPLV